MIKTYEDLEKELANEQEKSKAVVKELRLVTARAAAIEKEQRQLKETEHLLAELKLAAHQVRCAVVCLIDEGFSERDAIDIMIRMAQDQHTRF